MPSVYPPIDEQWLIVRFLDWHGAQTARLIRAKKKLIALLNEQKQAIIHRAVTLGLDQNVKLKPSGVPWLGEVPATWSLRKIRHCGSIAGGMTPSMENRSFWDGSIPWVTPKDMKRRVIADSMMHVTQEAVEKTSIGMIKAGAVLMVVRGMILARRIPIAKTTAPVTINQDMKAIIPEKSVQSDFLCHVLASFQSALSSLIGESGHGTRRFPTERWREMAFAFPSFMEQSAISSWIDNASVNEDRAIASAEREVALLLEFRSRLVADVVTGKLDVRAAAASLPAIVDMESAGDLSDDDDVETETEDVETEELAA